MCDPATVGTLMLVSTAVSVAGTGFTALQASQQSRYQAKVADRNADLAREAAVTERSATQQAALQHYREVAKLKGQQRVAMAANGLDINFGNAADLQVDTEMLANEDVRRIYDQGAQRQRGFEIEQSNYSGAAQASRQAATGALIGGGFNMAGTALGGASQYSNYKLKMGSSVNSYGIKGAGEIY